MSTVKVGTLQNLSGTEVYTCKAWVNFNGTGTVAIRGSGNVSSITDNGTALYTVNFVVAMPDTNYALSGSANNTSTVWMQSVGFSGDSTQSPIKSTTQAKIFVTHTGGAIDNEQISVMIFR